MSLSKEEALKKLQRYCAYQDRCHSEVLRKLNSLGVWGEWAEEIKAELVRENFLNEERFARSYARGKFRMKAWGKVRIIRELEKRHISDYCIRAALSEIDAEDYLESLKSVLQKKRESIGDVDAFAAYKKLTEHALRKGYEKALITPLVKELLGLP